MPGKQAGRGSAQAEAAKRLNAAYNQLTTWLDRSPAAKRLVGNVVGVANMPAGIGRGLVHTGEGLLKTAVIGQALMNPLAPQSQFVLRQQLRTGQNIARQTQRAVADPRAAVGAAGQRVQAYTESVDPSRTPMANTFEGEMERRAAIGRNQGELVFDVASLAYGGVGLRGLSKAGMAPRHTVADYLADGYTQRQAERLAGPYEGMAHHAVKRRWTKDLPESIRNNPFFVYRPGGLTQGQFYEQHFKIDPQFYGARLPDGGGWSGRRERLERYGLLDRHAYGMPTPNRVVVIGNAVGAGQGLYSDVVGGAAP